MTGPGKPQVTFAVSEDPTLIEAVKLDKGVRASIARRVLPCRAGDLYASMSFNDAYRDLLLDHGDSAYEKANGELFESFLAALIKERRCPISAEWLICLR